MTDKFPMHSDFPMDEAYKAKAAERGFAGEKALWLFEEWRGYWTGRPSVERTPRGWLQCWDNNLKGKARNGANSKGGRFERRDDNRMPSRPEGQWVGGQWFSAFDIIGLKHKKKAGYSLSHAEQEALSRHRQVMKAWEQ